MEKSEEYPLSPEQERIVQAPADYPQLVIAPPGAGKTHVVVGRILNLIQKEGLTPGELLVLCYTRTAAAEVSKRIRRLVKDSRANDDLRFLTIRTFDSFASRLLFAVNPEVDLSPFDYDTRIKTAIAALTDRENAASRIIQGFRHLIVDEIQDVVGVRAELVKLLLQRISGSFTLLGDPAQAIFNWSTENGDTGRREESVLEWVRHQEWIGGVERELSENHRATSALAKKTTAIRKDVLDEGDDDPEALARLRAFITGLDKAGSGKEPRLPETAPDNTLCVLCRNNGEVLQMASLFQRKGIPFYLKPRPEDRGLPPWLGRVFGTFTAATISCREFESRWKDLVGSSIPVEPERAWDWLKRVEEGDRDHLDLKILRTQLGRGKTLPEDQDAYLQASPSGIHISTIHSVKGREFDHVIVLHPDSGQNGGSTKEEARILYVAATRAKKELSSIGREGLPRMWKQDAGNGQSRWLARTGEYYFMEIGLHGDVETGSAANRYLFPGEQDAGQAQNFLWESLHGGDHVDIKKVIVPGGRFDYAFFNIMTRKGTAETGRILGQMSMGFKNSLKWVIRGISHRNNAPYPDHMENLQVAAIVTEILPPFNKNIVEPYASSRFCLGIRLRGMGYIYRGSHG